jgi:iron only hydrogenase large subunit-like protein
MDFLATSCCPAWVRTAKKHVPEIADRVSSTPTPLHYTAVRAKSEIPEAITVFIGPCLSKRAEGYEDPSVDYVMSLEELGALFMAKDIDVLNSADLQLPVKPSKEARGFASTGGVAAAVQAKLPAGVKVSPRVINGINKESIKVLRSLAKDSGGADLVEVMACEGGCIAGPQVLTHPKVALIQLKKIMED